MVTKKSKEELFYLKNNYFIDTAETVFGAKVNEFSENEEVYTDGEHIVEVDRANELINVDIVRSMLKENNLVKDFVDNYCDMEFVVLTKFGISNEKIEELLYGYALDDMEFYLTYLWEEYNAKKV